MSDVVTTEPRGGAISRAWHSRTATKLLLLSGIVAVGLYGVGDLVSGLFYEGYSYRDQAISELSAFGSPVRPVMVRLVETTKL